MSDVYNPVFNINWPGPGVLGVSIVLSLILIAVAVFIIINYYKIKERDKLHNNQLFLFQVKRKGLSNFQIKILNNMAAYLRLKSPTTLVSNAKLFESILSDFIEYLKKSSESSDEQKSICRDLVIIYEKLYVQSAYRVSLESMSEIENGQILHLVTDAGSTFLGKVNGRGKNFLALQLFTPAKNLKDFETEQQLTIYLVRINDAEYSVKTKSIGLDENNLLVEFSENFVREKEYRHPYVNVVLPAIVSPVVKKEDEEDAGFEVTIYKLNEYECELRADNPIIFDRSYNVAFEVSDYSFNVQAKVISSRRVEHGRVYYVTFKFTNMSKPAAAVLTSFINENL